MAVKNADLDGRIAQAAREEFLEKGFRGASLHKIAAKAGVTTGAIYTRYSGKDDLFRSLLGDAAQQIRMQLGQITRDYCEAPQTPEGILEACRQEEVFFLDILRDHYEESVLFFCRSDGSSVEQVLHELLEKKAAQTAAYFQSMTDKPIPARSIRLLQESAFYYYRRVLEMGMSPEEAAGSVALLNQFMNAGWRQVLSLIL